MFIYKDGGSLGEDEGWVQGVTFGSDRIRTYRGEERKDESGGQLSTVHTRTRAGETRARQEKT